MGSARSFVIITMTAFTALFILFTWSVETTSEVETGLQVLEMNDTERLHRALLLQPRTHSWTISARPILLMALLLTVIVAVVMSNGGAETYVSTHRRRLGNDCGTQCCLRLLPGNNHGDDGGFESQIVPVQPAAPGRTVAERVKALKSDHRSCHYNPQAGQFTLHKTAARGRDRAEEGSRLAE